MRPLEAQDTPPVVQCLAELDGGATLVGSAMGSMALHAFVGRFGVGYRISMTERERTGFTRGGFFGATHPRESLRADVFHLKWAAPILTRRDFEEVRVHGRWRAATKVA